MKTGEKVCYSFPQQPVHDVYHNTVVMYAYAITQHMVKIDNSIIITYYCLQLVIILELSAKDNEFSFLRNCSCNSGILYCFRQFYRGIAYIIMIVKYHYDVSMST